MSEAEVCQLGVVPILKEKLLRRWRNGSAGGRLARARLADADDDDDVPGTASEQAQLGLLVGGLQGRRRRRDEGGRLVLEKRAIFFSAQEDIKWQFESGRRRPP